MNYYTKFVPNWFINIQTHANYKILLMQSVEQQLFPVIPNKKQSKTKKKKKKKKKNPTQK